MDLCRNLKEELVSYTCPSLPERSWSASQRVVPGGLLQLTNHHRAGPCAMPAEAIQIAPGAIGEACAMLGVKGDGSGEEHLSSLEVLLGFLKEVCVT